MSLLKSWFWPGVFTVAILTTIALWMKADFIESDLKQKATAALEANGQSWATVVLDGRDATISGDAPSKTAQNEAQRIADEAYDIRIVSNNSGLLALQNPYTFNMTKSGPEIVLSGFAPDQSTKDQLIKSAKTAFEGSKVEDKLTLARGAPNGFRELVEFGYAQLSGLIEGKASLSGTEFSISGTTETLDSFNAVNKAISGAMPNGTTLAENNVIAPAVSPYTWGAEVSDSEVKLTGYVPSRSEADALVLKAKSLLPGAAVADEQLIASGQPEGFVAKADFALKQLARFSSGSVGLNNSELTMSGVAKSSGDYDSAVEITDKPLPNGLKLGAAEIIPPTVSPYVWSAKKVQDAVDLNGFVPSKDVRASILSAVKKSAPGAQINDQTKIAAGAPSGFANAARFGVNQLGRLSQGTVSLSDRAFAIGGVASTPQDYQAAIVAVSSGLPGGLTLASNNITPASVSPYLWSAEFNGTEVSLGGYVPSDAAREKIASQVQAALPSATIKDKMELAVGEPTQYEAATGFAIDQLPHLASGSFSLSDSNLNAQGIAKTSNDFSQIKSALGENLPQGLVLTSEEISPATVSPFIWGAEYDGSQVTLNGFVPNNGTRKALIAKTAGHLPNAEVRDDMQVAAGASASFLADASAALGILRRFSKGSVALSGNNFSTEGVGKSSAHYLAAERYVQSGLPETLKLARAEISPPANDGDYVWRAQKTASSVILSGLAPSKNERLSIAKFARRAVPGRTVVNRITVETGAPANYRSNVDRGLTLLGSLKTGEVKLKNDDLNVTGVASSVAAYEAILAADGDVSSNVQPAAISPYSWSLTKQKGKAVVSGFAPNLGVGNSLASAAAATIKLPVENKQRVAAGAPNDFGSAAAALITGVAELDDGLATLTDKNLFLQGRAESEDAATEVRDRVSGLLPNGYSLRDQISFILPEPAPEVVLKEEFVPEPVPEPAPEVVFKEEFVPQPVPDPVPEIVLKEEFVPQPVPDKIPEVVLKEEPKAEPEAPVCNVDFAALFDGEKIQFDTARAVIRPSSYPLLDRIAAGLKSCRDSKVEIGGHTDARGSASYNLALSNARAKAVMHYLVDKKGISPNSLEAKGYGETQPIAPNTADERSKNRRIDFKSLQQ